MPRTARGASTFLSGRREFAPAGPAQLEGAGIILAASRALHVRAWSGRLKKALNQFPSSVHIRGIVDPYLRQRRINRQLARNTRGVCIQDAHPNAVASEQIGKQVRLGKIGGAKDALHLRHMRRAQDRARVLEIHHHARAHAVFVHARAPGNAVIGEPHPDLLGERATHAHQ